MCFSVNGLLNQKPRLKKFTSFDLLIEKSIDLNVKNNCKIFDDTFWLKKMVAMLKGSFFENHSFAINFFKTIDSSQMNYIMKNSLNYYSGDSIFCLNLSKSSSISLSISKCDNF